MKEFLNYITNKSVLIVGGSPDVANKPKEWYDSFDVIVRINNYKMVNSDRCDVFFSYFGRNIKKTPEELLADGVKFCVNKCPNANITELDANDQIQMHDYRWIYELRKHWWFCPLIEISKDELLKQIESLFGYMPTSGMSAVMFFRTYCVPTIIGFDCFESGLHNVDEKWDSSGGHRPEIEKEYLSFLNEIKVIKWVR